MPNIAQVLKEEIARIARREIRQEAGGLKEANSRLRERIKDLLDQVTGLKTRMRQLERSVERVGRRPAEKISVSGVPARARNGAFSPKAFSAWIDRCGLKHPAAAMLFGASVNSIIRWKTGQSVPRAKQREKFEELRHLGKKAVAKLISSEARQ